MSQAQLEMTADEVVNRGAAIYNEKLRSAVETPENVGKFISIDILSGGYAIGEQHLDTSRQVRAAHPGAVICTLRIGYPAAVSMSGRMQPLTRP